MEGGHFLGIYPRYTAEPFARGSHGDDILPALDLRPDLRPRHLRCSHPLSTGKHRADHARKPCLHFQLSRRRRVLLPECLRMVSGRRHSADREPAACPRRPHPVLGWHAPTRKSHQHLGSGDRQGHHARRVRHPACAGCPQHRRASHLCHRKIHRVHRS